MNEPLVRPARVKHFANIGDIIAMLPALRQFYETTKRKIIFCQQLDVPGHYYDGATHPTLDKNNIMVMCNQQMYDMVKPLLLAQDYIADVEIFNGQPLAIDLDRIRQEIFVNMPHQAIQQWPFMAFPDLGTDLSKAWIDIPEVDLSTCAISYMDLLTSYLVMPDLTDKIVVNFTERYRNPHINYFFLKNYESRLLFSGTEREHQLFCEQWKLDIPRIIVRDFLQLAAILKKAKFLLSNQSFLWNVSFAMKTPHVLELCHHADNCQCFMYEDSLGFLLQKGAQFYFEKLINKL